MLLRIKLRYDDVETMVQRFAPNVGKAGLFLPTKSMQPIGAEVKFELRLANDTAVIVGLGRVKHVRPADPAHPRAVVGIGIELMRVTRESRDVIMKMLERRRQMGLAETALPTADEIDAARREVDTGVRITPAPARPMIEPPPEPLLTAPRRASGPIAVQKVVEVAETSRPVVVPPTLAPEPSRRHVRRSINELIASAAPAAAASITADLFGGADEVDVKAVLARARTLAAGTDLDAELDALRESAAAPIEISVEAASAELARALGGAAVSRKARGAGWVVPPPSAPAPAVTEVEPPRPEPEPEPEPVAATPAKSVAAIAIAALAGEARVESRSFIDEPAPEGAHEEHELDDALVEAEEELDPRQGYIRDEPEPEPEPELDPDTDEPLAFVPSTPEQIITEPHHDAVGSGLLIDDDVDPSVFEGEAPHDEFSMDPDLGERTQFGAVPLPDIDGNERLDEALAAAEAAGDADEDFGFPSDPIEEIDDFEILAEADVEADHAELVVAEVGPRYPTDGDFVARLELSNEHSAVPDDPLSGFGERDSVVAFGDAPSYDQQEPYPEAGPVDPLAGFSDDPAVDPSYGQNYVRSASRIQHVQAAAVPQQMVWDPTTGQYVYPNQYEQPVYAAAPPIEGDLEDALEALDVDLDELGGPPVQPQPHRTPRPAILDNPNQRRGRPPRATSEDDGILIDFDDDE